MIKKWTSILHTANNFSSTVDYLFDFMSKYSNEHIVNRTIKTPLIVNAAFACELYLKTIIAFEKNEDKNKHDLLDLFELLTVESQEIITNEALKKISLNTTDEFIQLLQINKTAFIEFRYIYEFKVGQKEKTANYIFLIEFNKLLYSYIQQITTLDKLDVQPNKT